MNILMLTNARNESTEDSEIASRLGEDGHSVTMSWLDFSGDLSSFDLILRRNVWVEEEDEVEDYRLKLVDLIGRIKQLGIKSINLEELMWTKKEALVDLSKVNENWIIPTRHLDEIDDLGEHEKFVVKEIDSVGSGIGQFYLSKEEIASRNFDKSKYIVQPKLTFDSEVQFYYVGKELLYALEYSPSKFPDYPDPKQIYITDEEKFISDFYVVSTGFEYGFLRADFVRIGDSIKLMEMEATSPHMCFKDIPDFEKKRAIERYVKSIYEYCSSNNE